MNAEHVRMVLVKHDPMVMNAYDGEDAYRCEAEDLVQRVATGDEINSELVRAVMHDWFGRGIDAAGREYDYGMPMRDEFFDVAADLAVLWEAEAS